MSTGHPHTADAPNTGKDATFGPETATRRFSSVTHDILGDPFWAVYRRGLADAAEHLGCQVHHVAPQRFDPGLMAELLEQAVDAEPEGILATVPDAEAVEAPLRRAIERGIPVVAINAADPRPAQRRIPYLRYVGADDTAGGRAAATRMLERPGGRPTRALAVDHYLVDNACHSERCTGFAEVLEAEGIPAPRLRVPGDDPDASVAAIVAELERHPDLDCVLTLGPPGCATTIRALTETGRIAAVRHGSFDLAPAQLEAIAGGRLEFTVDSQQYLQGYLGLTLLSLYVEHGLLPAADVLTGPSFVDAASVDAARAAVREGRR